MGRAVFAYPTKPKRPAVSQTGAQREEARREDEEKDEEGIQKIVIDWMQALAAVNTIPGLRRRDLFNTWHLQAWGRGDCAP